MTPLAIATMTVICGIVWGGFAVLLVHAFRSEGRKQAEERAAETGASAPGA